MKLTQKTILITGGTSGIGLALAGQLLRRGNAVLVTGRDPDKLTAAKNALPELHTFQSDAADPEAIRALGQTVLAEFPALDVLICNAGVMRNLDFRAGRNGDKPLADPSREIELNLSGPIALIQQFLPHLQSRPEALIVTVSSGLAFVPMPAAPVYCAAKAGLHSFTQSLRVQLAGTSVAVVELAPPGVETPLFRGEFAEETHGQKGMSAEALAKDAIAGIEAGATEIRPGLSNVLHTMSRVAPKFMLAQMTQMTKPKNSKKS